MTEPQPQPPPKRFPQAILISFALGITIIVIVLLATGSSASTPKGYTDMSKTPVGEGLVGDHLYHVSADDPKSEEQVELSNAVQEAVEHDSELLETVVDPSTYGNSTPSSSEIEEQCAPGKTHGLIECSLSSNASDGIERNAEIILRVDGSNIIKVYVKSSNVGDNGNIDLH